LQVLGSLLDPNKILYAAQIILGWRNATNLGRIRFWLELDPMYEQHLVYYYMYVHMMNE
jgi:hypothetical protein